MNKELDINFDNELDDEETTILNNADDNSDTDDNLTNFNEVITKLNTKLSAIKALLPLEQMFHQIEVLKENPLSKSLLSTQKPKFLPLIYSSHLQINNKKLPQLLAKASKYGSLFLIDSNSESSNNYAFKLANQLKSVNNIFTIQKDLVIDAYQVYQARFYGFSVISFLACLLKTSELLSLILLAKELGMESIIWVLNKQDLQKALKTPCRFLAISTQLYQDLSISSDQELLNLAEEIPNDRYLILEPQNINTWFLKEAKELDTFAIIYKLDQMIPERLKLTIEPL